MRLMTEVMVGAFGPEAAQPRETTRRQIRQGLRHLFSAGGCFSALHWYLHSRCCVQWCSLRLLRMVTPPGPRPHVICPEPGGSACVAIGIATERSAATRAKAPAVISCVLTTSVGLKTQIAAITAGTKEMTQPCLIRLRGIS